MSNNEDAPDSILGRELELQDLEFELLSRYGVATLAEIPPDVLLRESPALYARTYPLQ